MEKNIALQERVTRVLGGIVIIALFSLSIWSLFGLELALTGILGWSPLYKMTHISTAHRLKHRVVSPLM